MSNITKIIVLVLFLLVLIMAFVGTEKEYQWYPIYDETKSQPYSTGVLEDLLETNYKISVHNRKDRLDNWLPTSDVEKSIYFFIDNRALYTEAEAEKIFEYANQGGTAFLALDALPDSLMQFLLFFEDCGWSDWQEQNRQGRRRVSSRFLENFSSESVVTGFTHPSFKQQYTTFSYEQERERAFNSWAFLPGHYFCNQAQYPITNLGFTMHNLSEIKDIYTGNVRVDIDQAVAESNQDEVFDEISLLKKHYNFQERDSAQGRNYTLSNFFRFQVGKGYIYFHTQPVLFTNFFLITKPGYQYAQNVFAHLGSGKTIHWDRAARYQPDAPIERPRRQLINRSPMEFIFSQTALRTAWYLLLAATFLFVVFRGKRRQRVVPILPKNRNTALDFVKSIAKLYFLEQNHVSILEKQMQFFLSHIRQRYRLSTRELDEALMLKIAQRANVSPSTVNDIFKKYERVREHLRNNPQGLISATTLNEFYTSIQKFHAEAKLAEQSEKAGKA